MRPSCPPNPTPGGCHRGGTTGSRLPRRDPRSAAPCHRRAPVLDQLVIATRGQQIALGTVSHRVHDVGVGVPLPDLGHPWPRPIAARSCRRRRSRAACRRETRRPSTPGCRGRRASCRRRRITVQSLRLRSPPPVKSASGSARKATAAIGPAPAPGVNVWRSAFAASVAVRSKTLVEPSSSPAAVSLLSLLAASERTGAGSPGRTRTLFPSAAFQKRTVDRCPP